MKVLHRFILTFASSIIDQPITRPAVASVWQRQIDANVRTISIVHGALVHVAASLWFVLAIWTVGLLIADLAQWYAHTSTAFEFFGFVAFADNALCKKYFSVKNKIIKSSLYVLKREIVKYILRMLWQDHCKKITLLALQSIQYVSTSSWNFSDE